MDIARIATTRYTAKAYNPNKRIDDALIEQLQTLLRYAPSSTNSQPWHFLLAASDEAKSSIARATTGPYVSNEPKILNASHVFILCSHVGLEDAHLQRILEQEDKDGRFKSQEDKETMKRVRDFYVEMHRNQLHDTRHWMEKQVYLALGVLLFGAAALEIDATPIEGFDREVLDESLALRERGLASVVMVALGYHSDDDFNASLPKSRLPAEELFTYL